MKNGIRRFLYALLIAIFISGNIFQGISAAGQALPQADKAAPEVGHNPETGKVSFIGGGTPITIPGASGVHSLTAQNKAQVAAELYGPQFGLKNPSQELTLSRTANDGNGHAITRYQQVYQGIPVLAGELIFNMNSNGDLLSASGEVSSDLSLDTHPAISGEAASQTALGVIAKWHKVDTSSLIISKPELMIFDESLLKASIRAPQLVWHLEVDARDSQPIREMVLINAQTGTISLHINQVDINPKTSSTTSDAIGTEGPLQNPTVGPATWYVATSGNDSYACSAISAPCATINGALGKAAAGDTIKVASGTYTGSGDSVVTIYKSIQLLGGWDAAFTTQNGQTVIDGQDARKGIFIFQLSSTGLTVEISQITVQNSSGGAVYVRNTDGTTNLNRVAVINNPGFGIYNYIGGNINITNSTISGNHGSDAIANISGHINIQYSTITNNTGTYDYAIYASGQVDIGNSILAGNSDGDCYGNITSYGHNIFGRSPACNNTITIQTSDLVGTDPQLGPLTAGGYQVLTASSPAVDTADPASCPATDQRGVVRPYGVACDIGAYEYMPTGPAAAISVAGGAGQTTGFDQPLLRPLMAFVADSNGSPVSGAAVTFTAPVTDASGTFSDSGTNTTTAVTNNTGIATTSIYTANDISGTYSISASTPGVAGTAGFSITNRELYVSSSGNDSWDCLTPATACLTINSALAKAPNGAGISIATGTYTGSGSYVVTISKSIHLIGGWDAGFATQNGQSIIDGQASNSGIYIHGSGLSVDLSRINVQNSGGAGGFVAVYDDNTGGTTTFNRVALINNGGNGLYNYTGNVNFTNTTISGNHAIYAGSAISNVNGHINIQYSTIVNNTGTSDYAIWGTNGSAQIEMGNSILAGNTVGDCYANITSDGHNIFGRSPTCHNTITTQPSDQVGVDPRIGPLTSGGIMPCWPAARPSMQRTRLSRWLPINAGSAARKAASATSVHSNTSPGRCPRL